MVVVFPASLQKWNLSNTTVKKTNKAIGRVKPGHLEYVALESTFWIQIGSHCPSSTNKQNALVMVKMAD